MSKALSRIKVRPLYLGRVLGIPIRAHYSWLPVFPLYAWAISSSLLPREAHGLAGWQYWVLGIFTTALMFGSVLAHELAHAVMARAEGLGTGSITLYIFGGLASLEGQPSTPSSEFKIAIVGPAASFLTGTLFFALNQALLAGTTHLVFAQVLRHLGLINWMLAGFNILPGLPLDGGRVLRAILWRFNKNYYESTRMAVRAGLTIALVLFLYGSYFFIFVEWITGLWSMIIGLILVLLLKSSEASALGAHKIRRGSVEVLMNRSFLTIDPDLSVREFIDGILEKHRAISFPVGRGGRLHGMLLLADLKPVPSEEWSRLRIQDVMRPVEPSMFINAIADEAEARALLGTNGIGSVVVLDSDGMIVGQLGLKDLKSGRPAAAHAK